MGQPSLEPNDKLRLQALEDQVRELHRKRPRQHPNLRDLQDVNGWGAQNGYITVYDSDIGRYRTWLAPPFLKFSTVGDMEVAESGHDPVAGAGRLILVRGRLAVAGSTTTTVSLKHNGNVVVTLTFGSGATTPSYSVSEINEPFDAEDYFSLDITAVGTDAAKLVVAGWGTAGSAP